MLLVGSNDPVYQKVYVTHSIQPTKKEFDESFLCDFYLMKIEILYLVHLVSSMLQLHQTTKFYMLGLLVCHEKVAYLFYCLYYNVFVLNGYSYI